MINTATQIVKHIDTGKKPFFVLADNLENYIAKGSRPGATDFLVAEYLVANAAKSCGVLCPEPAIINVLPEHRPEGETAMKIGINWSIPCFGSNEVGGDLVTTEKVDRIAKHVKKYGLQNELLSIFVFDNWIANEDRNVNYNLLFDPKRENNCFHVIDHEMSFNTCAALGAGLAPLTYEDGLANTYLFDRVFKGRKENKKDLERILKQMDSWRSEVKQGYQAWLNECPESWMNSKAKWENFIQNHWLSADWMKQVEENCVNLLTQVTK